MLRAWLDPGICGKCQPCLLSLLGYTHVIFDLFLSGNPCIARCKPRRNSDFCHVIRHWQLHRSLRHTVPDRALQAVQEDVCTYPQMVMHFVPQLADHRICGSDCGTMLMTVMRFHPLAFTDLTDHSLFSQKQHILLVLFLLLLEVCAAVWYSVSYIPYGRTFIKNTCLRPCKDMCKDEGEGNQASSG